MRGAWSNRTGPAKALILCVTLLLVAAGLCGIQWAIVQGRGDSSPFVSLLILTGIIELAVMALSAAGAVVALIVWICMLIFNRPAE